MKHAKFVSFTLCGAQTVQKAVKLLPDFRCERYARTVDASLSGTSLKRFAQQAMVDCDLIVFVGATGIAVRAAAIRVASEASIALMPARRRNPPMTSGSIEIARSTAVP